MTIVCQTSSEKKGVTPCLACRDAKRGQTICEDTSRTETDKLDETDLTRQLQRTSHHKVYDRRGFVIESGSQVQHQPARQILLHQEDEEMAIAKTRGFQVGMCPADMSCWVLAMLWSRVDSTICCLMRGLGHTGYVGRTQDLECVWIKGSKRSVDDVMR